MLSQTACAGRLCEEVGRVVTFLGRKGVKCFASSKGPMVLIAKVLSTESAEYSYKIARHKKRRKKKIDVLS
jgi:hypothetical protein